MKQIWGRTVNTKLIEMLGLCEQKRRALDVGCGAGANSLFLLTNGFNDVDAIDVVADNEKLIKTMPLEEGQSINFFNTNIESFTTNNKYDLIIALNILHFINSESLDKVFTKIKDWLNPAGIFYFRVFSTKEIAGKNFKTKHLSNDYIIKGRQMHFFTEIEIRQWLSDYQILELNHISLPDDHPPLGRHQHWVFDVIVRN